MAATTKTKLIALPITLFKSEAPRQRALKLPGGHALMLTSANAIGARNAERLSVPIEANNFFIDSIVETILYLVKSLVAKKMYAKRETNEVNNKK